MQIRFQSGEKVRVLHLEKTGHIRTPFYVRGKIGTVVEFCGTFLNPEDLAVGKTSGPVIPLYRVSFEQSELWPEYDGPVTDKLYIEIYDHWLTSAVQSSSTDETLETAT